jgi:hypothetical protein
MGSQSWLDTLRRRRRSGYRGMRDASRWRGGNGRQERCTRRPGIKSRGGGSREGQGAQGGEVAHPVGGVQLEPSVPARCCIFNREGNSHGITQRGKCHHSLHRELDDVRGAGQRLKAPVNILWHLQLFRNK